MSDNYYENIFKDIYKRKKITTLNNKLNKLYTFDNNNSYILNSAILFFSLVIIGLLYVYKNMKMDEKTWDVQKCNPKYIFYSGYIRRNKGQDARNSTFDNFFECTNKKYENINKNLVENLLSKNDGKFNDYVIKRYGNYSKDVDDLTKNIQEKQNELRDIQKDIMSNPEQRKHNKSFKQKMVLYNDHMNAYIYYLNLYIRQNIKFNILQNVGDFAYGCMNKNRSCDRNTKEYKNAMLGISKLNSLNRPYYDNNSK
tara:strand:- start:674 stop:1438 length:765 start_codon:yes stop_codon:yes gene_type:complete